jgi:hypothetical protein
MQKESSHPCRMLSKHKIMQLHTPSVQTLFIILRYTDVDNNIFLHVFGNLISVSFTFISLFLYNIDPHNCECLQSARVSVPPRVIFSDGVWKWRTDLVMSRAHWQGWFTGFSDLFLSQPCPKLVCVSNTNVMDRSMIIAQMQGKFETK